MTDTISTWHKDFLNALDMLENIHLRLASPPSDGSVDSRLPLLLEVFHRLGPLPSEIASPVVCATRWIDKVADAPARISLIERITQSLLDVDNTIANTLDRGAGTDSLIRTADFGEIQMLDSGQRLQGSMSAVYFAVGFVQSLKTTDTGRHRLHDVLPADEFYLFGGTSPSIILGPMRSGRTPRRWYFCSEAMRFTREFRSVQVRKQQEDSYLNRLRDEAAERERKQGELQQLRQRVRDLEQR